MEDIKICTTSKKKKCTTVRNKELRTNNVQMQSGRQVHTELTLAPDFGFTSDHHCRSQCDWSSPSGHLHGSLTVVKMIFLTVCHSLEIGRRPQMVRIQTAGQMWARLSA